MERLTTNKDVQEMTMTELAHNCCYAKDRNARYRDFDMDMDAREFARNLMITLANDELSNDDDEFDEEILENLQYDQFSDVKGLIALLYRNLWAMADLRERLKSYEDAEEQGLLLRLPCKVGDTVYCIHKNEIIEDTVFDYDIWSLKNGISLRISLENYRDYIVGIFGKTVFLTYQEAELELANIQQSHAEAIMDERNGR